MDERLRSIVERIQNSAAIKSVFGDAISAHGRTIIPVARIVYGFGGGSGKGVHDGESGEGGGGGVMAAPLGVIELTDGQTRFIPVNEHRKFVAGCLIGLCAGILWARAARRRIKV